MHTDSAKFGVGSIGSALPMSYDSVSSPGQFGYGLSDDLSWITYNGVKLLWLPAEYRPARSSLFAIFATKLAIICPSGRVIFLVLAEQ